MKRNIITISDSGTITVPNNNIRMTITEIADLFGIYDQTAKKLIRDIEKSSVASGDYSMCCIVEGSKIYPDYYGVEMVIAVAFRMKSKNAEILREWVIHKACQPNNILQFPKSENDCFFCLN